MRLPLVRPCSRASAPAWPPHLPASWPPPPRRVLQAKQGFGLVEGHASVEDLIEEADGFAEVFPEHKFMIVKTLQVCRGLTAVPLVCPPVCARLMYMPVLQHMSMLLPC